MKRVLTLLLAVALMFSLVACGANEDPPAASNPPAADPPAATDTPPSGDEGGDTYDGPVMTVKVAAICPVTGPNSRRAELEEAAIAAAEAHMAEDNYINPAYQIEFIRPFIDDENTTDRAPVAANLAISMEVNAVINHHQTPMVLISAPLFEEAKIANFSMVSGPAVCEQGWEYQHIGTVTDTDAAVTLADYLIDVRGIESILVACLNDEGGIAGANAVIARLEEKGLDVPDENYMLFEATDTNFSAYALKASELGVDCVLAYQISGANGLVFYDQVEQLYAPIPEEVAFIGSTAFAQPTMAELWPHDKLEKVAFPSGFIQDPNDPFKARFRESFQENDPQHMLPGDNDGRVYDACWNIATAINLLAENDGYIDPTDPTFNERLNYWVSQIDREGVQGHINYKGYTDGRMLEAANIGEWGPDGVPTKVFPVD